jgi:CRP/FNR family cyclic AMP-dependent transcriptional regulator
VAKKDVLKTSPFFKDLTDAELAAVDPIVLEKTLPPGTTLFLEGMLGESMYIVVSGSIKIGKMIEEGHEQVLTVLKAGDHFGEMAVIEKGPRAASAVSTSEAKILILRRKDFIELSKKQPAVCFKVLLALATDISRRSRELGEKYGKMLAQEAPEA